MLPGGLRILCGRLTTRTRRRPGHTRRTSAENILHQCRNLTGARCLETMPPNYMDLKIERAEPLEFQNTALGRLGAFVVHRRSYHSISDTGESRAAVGIIFQLLNSIRMCDR